MGNIVAIVGRPNVGKSTLFNRLTESRSAIVDPTSGVTRDRHYGKVEWCGEEFGVIDTGGYTHGTDDIFETQIRRQVELAIEEADLIIFMVDALNGITDFDEAIAEMLRRSKKKVLMAANKIDTSDKEYYTADFYSLGMGEVFPLSGSNGHGSGDLLDAVVKNLVSKKNDDEEGIPKFAVVGKPNVGKSSLINALTGSERNIVTDVSGTTRDSINTRYNSYGFDFFLVDTAGIRKRAKVHEDIEFYSVVRSIRSIEESDVCLFLIDAQDGFEKQDLNIFYMVEKAKKGIVILVNKWDVIEKDSASTKEFEDKIRERIAPFTNVPIVFTSALTKQRIHKALEMAVKVYQSRTQKIPTSTINEVMLKAIEKYGPPAIKGKYVRIKYVMQLPTYTPAFAFFCNLPQYVKDPYKRYLENKLREHFDFEGVPIRIFMRKK